LFSVLSTIEIHGRWQRIGLGVGADYITSPESRSFRRVGVYVGVTVSLKGLFDFTDYNRGIIG